MTQLEKAREFFSNDLYATKTTGIQIDAVSSGYAKCSLKLENHHRNAMGQVMGGVIFTLADFVFAVAANFENEFFTVSTVGNIFYLNPVKGDTLYGESRILKDGKSTAFYEIEISDNLGTKVATVTFTGTHLSK